MIGEIGAEERALAPDARRAARVSSASSAMSVTARSKPGGSQRFGNCAADTAPGTSNQRHMDADTPSRRPGWRRGASHDGALGLGVEQADLSHVDHEVRGLARTGLGVGMQAGGGLHPAQHHYRQHVRAGGLGDLDQGVEAMVVRPRASVLLGSLMCSGRTPRITSRPA